MNLILTGEVPLRISQQVPAHLSRYLFRNAQCRYRAYQHVEMLSQVKQGSEFLLCTHVIRTAARVSLVASAPAGELVLHYQLRGKMHLGDTRLSGGEYRAL